MPWWLLNEGREWPLKVRPQMTQLPTNLIICCLNLAFSNLEILLPTSQCSKLYYDLGMQPYITFTLLRLDPLRNFHLVPNILLLYPAICWHQKYALWFKQSPGIFLLKKKKPTKQKQNPNQLLSRCAFLFDLDQARNDWPAQERGFLDYFWTINS